MLGVDMGILVNIWLGTESEVVEIKIAVALQGSSDKQLLAKTEQYWAFVICLVLFNVC